MAVVPEPSEDGPKFWRWLESADEETRAAHPQYYWFHRFEGTPEFLWDERVVSEGEFRAQAPRAHIKTLDAALMDAADRPLDV